MRTAKMTAWAAVTMIALAIVGTINGQSSEWRRMKPDQLMAVDEKTLNLALDMAMQKDFEAMARLCIQGKIRPPSTGKEQVALVDVDLNVFSSSTMTVRMKGETRTWCVYVDALEPKKGETVAKE
jgi:type II secretory pathway component PulK